MPSTWKRGIGMRFNVREADVALGARPVTVRLAPAVLRPSTGSVRGFAPGASRNLTSGGARTR